MIYVNDGRLTHERLRFACIETRCAAPPRVVTPTDTRYATECGRTLSFLDEKSTVGKLNQSLPLFTRVRSIAMIAAPLSAALRRH